MRIFAWSTQARTEHGVQAHIYTSVHKGMPDPARFRDGEDQDIQWVRGQKSELGPDDGRPEHQEVL